LLPAVLAPTTKDTTTAPTNSPALLSLSPLSKNTKKNEHQHKKNEHQHKKKRTPTQKKTNTNTKTKQYCTSRKHVKPLWFCIVACHLLWFTFTKALINVLVKKITKKRVVFKSTKKKGEDDGRGAVAKRRFCSPPGNVGDMEGTLDAWVLVASFSFSMVTALVGIFQMIDRPYTAQGDFR